VKVCIVPGCPTLTDGTRCATHARATDRQRGTRTQRGYGPDHAALRARWAPLVAAGTVDCHADRCLEPARRIAPGTPWDLGHTADRRRWTGPEHARCNRADGGRRHGPTG
jgi:hypothetical protein